MRAAVITPLASFASPYRVLQAVVGQPFTLFVQVYDLPDGEAATVHVSGGGSANFVGDGIMPVDWTPAVTGANKILLTDANGGIVGQSLIGADATPKAILLPKSASVADGTSGVEHRLQSGGRVNVPVSVIVRNWGAAQAKGDKVTVSVGQGQTVDTVPVGPLGTPQLVPTSRGQVRILGTYDLPELGAGDDGGVLVNVPITTKGGFTIWANPAATNERNPGDIGYSVYFGIAK